MFREMRLKDNQLSKEEAVEILEKGTNGTLALSGDDDYPYAVPISYTYADGKVYFHGTNAGGHKLDAIKRNNKVSICVVAKDEIIPDEFNTLYRSAIAFGKVQILEDEAEKQKCLELILEKYSADFIESGKKYAKAQWDNTATFEMTIDHLTGKKGT